jgi:hypothetical protein
MHSILYIFCNKNKRIELLQFFVLTMDFTLILEINYFKLFFISNLNEM